MAPRGTWRHLLAPNCPRRRFIAKCWHLMAVRWRRYDRGKAGHWQLLWELLKRGLT